MDPIEKPMVIAAILSTPFASAIGGISSSEIALRRIPAAKCCMACATFLDGGFGLDIANMLQHSIEAAGTTATESDSAMTLYLEIWDSLCSTMDVVTLTISL
eukprot:CAMPEP_0172154594 /NCGR_PEP_ID=MMETSP1050-20130122/2126_1 /TAXON_ID=233186 /ORGANISM="Cryptomonas curvata, Strain CCAP979/52" /LENGTH=101 /DNA_ID=CAMNT_0012823337 /DNA_START=486 /DNA_END=788 /DNA_ORIENTATION=+